MTLRHFAFDKIDENSLQHLIDTEVAEARDIEYKRVTYGGKDEERAEFLADVSSFANTAGGDLILGMAEEKGTPKELVPFLGDADQECLRLENMARDGLEPRITNLQTKAVPLAQGGAALVVRVPRSYNSPHRVIFKGKNRFWARSSGGKYEPNVDELRSLFTLAPQLTEHIRAFKMDRIAKIAGGDAPVLLMGTCCLVIHVIPFSAFDVRSIVSLPLIGQQGLTFPPLQTPHPYSWRFNFDGFIALSNVGDETQQQRAYVQVFRSGAMEAVTSTIDGQDQALNAIHIEAEIVRYSRQYLESLHSCNIGPPFAVMVSLIGTKGKQIKMEHDNWWGNNQTIELPRDQFHFVEAIFDEVPSDDQSCATTVRPILDQLANAAGYASAKTFGPDGKYLLKM